MYPKQSAKWLAVLALAVTTLLMSGDATRADAWSRSNDCGCNDGAPAASWSVPQPNAFESRPFWMRPTPSYTSSRKQIPVTHYQPRVTNDPLSGIAVTSLQPCNTYESQVRRKLSCSLWQRIVNWWHCQCCLGLPSSMPARTTCTPTSEWVVSAPEPAASPYYAPATNGRLPGRCTTFQERDLLQTRAAGDQ